MAKIATRGPPVSQASMPTTRMMIGQGVPTKTVSRPSSSERIPNVMELKNSAPELFAHSNPTLVQSAVSMRIFLSVGKSNSIGNRSGRAKRTDDRPATARKMTVAAPTRAGDSPVANDGSERQRVKRVSRVQLASRPATIFAAITMARPKTTSINASPEAASALTSASSSATCSELAARCRDSRAPDPDCLACSICSSRVARIRRIASARCSWSCPRSPTAPRNSWI